MQLFQRLNIILSVLLIGLCGRVSAATLEHKPYLQNATPSSIVIRWRTDTNTSTRVKYGTSPSSLTHIIDQPANSLAHEVEITQLIHGTRYY